MTNKEHIDWLVSVCKLGGTITTRNSLLCTFSRAMIPANAQYQIEGRHFNGDFIIRRFEYDLYLRNWFSVPKDDLVYFEFYQGAPNDIPRNA